MRNAILFIMLLFTPYGIPSCDEILETATKTGENTGLSNSEIIKGLKTALEVGTDSSVNVTSRINGFYKDEVIKILLPPEAATIYENKDNVLFRATGIDRKIEEAVLALNRAAEDAASQAGPIFKDAILNMSVPDGMAILKGSNPADPDSNSAAFDSTAATAYLKSTTYTRLQDAFSPKIDNSLNKKLVGDYSPKEVWNGLTSTYNEVAKRSFGMITPVETTDLTAYVTAEALDGIFYKVAQEEKKIRRDPWKWAQTSVGNILEKVFGKSW